MNSASALQNGSSPSASQPTSRENSHQRPEINNQPPQWYHWNQSTHQLAYRNNIRLTTIILTREPLNTILLDIIAVLCDSTLIHRVRYPFAHIKHHHFCSPKTSSSTNPSNKSGIMYIKLYRKNINKNRKYNHGNIRNNKYQQNRKENNNTNRTKNTATKQQLLATHVNNIIERSKKTRSEKTARRPATLNSTERIKRRRRRKRRRRG